MREEVLAARRPRSTSTGSERAAADARRVGNAGRLPGGARRCTAASCCPRTATTTGRTDRARGAGGAGRRAGRASSPALGSADDRRAAAAARGRELVRRAQPRARRAERAAPRARACSRWPAPAGVGKTRLALELARGSRAVVRRAARRSSSSPRSPTPRSFPTRSPPRSTCERCPGRASSTPWSTFLAPRSLLLVARQLRAPARGDGRARRHAAALRAAAHDPGDQPRAAARAGRGRVPGSVARHPGSRAGRSTPDELLALRGGAAVRRAGRRGGARLRARRGERGGRRPHLLPARRAAARARARRRPRWARSAPRRSPSDSTTASACCAPAATQRRRGSRRSRPRCSGATTCSSPTSGRCSGGSRSSPAASSSRRSRACAPAASSTPPSIADVLARLVEKSLVAADDGSSRERRYRLLETVRLYARERLERGGRERRARRPTRPLGARAGRAASAARRGSTATRRTCARRSTRCSSARRTTRCASASRCGRSGCAGSISHEAQRRFDEALAARPGAHGAAGGALLAAAAIEFRSGALAPGARSAEESYADRLRDRRRATPSGGRSSSSASSASPATRPTSRCRGSSARSSSPAARASRPRRRSASTRSASRTGSSATWPGPRSSSPQSIELFGALAGSPERIPSPVNIAEIRTSQPDGRPGLRIVFEDTLQPFVEISCDAAVSYVLANQAGIVARPRRSVARARALLDESAARFDDVRRRRGQGGGARPARVPRARRGCPSGGARALSRRRSSCGARRATGAASGSCSPGSGLSTRPPATTAAPSGAWPRPATSSGARAIGGGLPARSGGRPTSRLRAGASTTPRPRCRRRARCSARRSASGGSRTRSPGWPRSPCSAATTERATALLAEARDRYAARDDALGVADVERARCAELAKGAAKSAQRRRP